MKYLLNAVVDKNLHVQPVVFPVGSLVSAFLWEVRGTVLAAAPLAPTHFRPSPSLKKLFSYALNYSGKISVTRSRNSSSAQASVR